MAKVRAALSQRLTQAGRFDEAEREANAAVAAAPVGAPSRAFAFAARAFCAALRGQPSEALAGYGAARALQQSAGLVRQAAHSLMNEGAVLQSLGHGAARATLEEALAAARALGMRPVEGWALCNLGPVLARQGDAAGGIAAENAALAIARATSDAPLSAAARVERAMLHRGAGDPASALADATEAVALAAVARPQLVAAAHTACAAALLDLGRLDEALVQAERAFAARDAAHGMEMMEVDLLLVHHDILAALGRAADARAALAAARARLDALLARLNDPEHRRTFSENLPAHARVLRLGAA
jgi:tetratricopeptide (TPR) repeat protein